MARSTMPFEASTVAFVIKKPPDENWLVRLARSHGNSQLDPTNPTGAWDKRPILGGGVAESVQEVVLDRKQRRRDASAHADFVINVLEVVSHGVLAEHQLTCDTTPRI